MQPKPKHLNVDYASQFKDKSIVDAYQHRSPYPIETFEILSGLVANNPGSVLDVGCGTGYVARQLANYVERIDAVDFSENMIDMAKTLLNGHNPAINWICGSVEEVALNPPYALITAGASLHWMDWAIVFPRFKQILSENGSLAIVGQIHSPVPWQDGLQSIIDTYSTNRDYAPYSLIDELQSRGLFQKMGDSATKPELFQQSIDDYVESFHARNGFSRQRMTNESAEAFDHEMKLLVSDHCPDNKVSFQVSGNVIWGRSL